MTTTCYLREGSGEPTILLHAVGSRAEVWEPLLPRLRADRDVIALDLPGFGRSPLGSVRPTVQGYADHVAGLMDELDLVRPHVAGNSLGGAIALELGRRGLARSVVAFAPIGFWGAPGALWTRDVLTAMGVLAPWLRPAMTTVLGTRAGRIAAYSLFFGHPGDVPCDVLLADADAFIGSEALTVAVEGFADYVFTDVGLLDRIPTTIAWGSRDLVLPRRAQARRARQALPHAVHVTLRGCGHVPFFDDPVACALLLLNEWRPAAFARDRAEPSTEASTAVRRAS